MRFGIPFPKSTGQSQNILSVGSTTCVVSRDSNAFVNLSTQVGLCDPHLASILYFPQIPLNFPANDFPYHCHLHNPNFGLIQTLPIFHLQTSP